MNLSRSDWILSSIDIHFMIFNDPQPFTLMFYQNMICLCYEMQQVTKMYHLTMFQNNKL